MKKLLMASLLALGVTVACQQRASAWSEFKLSAGVSLSWCRSGSSGSWGIYSNRVAIPYPGCAYPGCPDGGYAAAAPAYYGGYAATGAEANYGGYAAQAPAAQAAPYASNPTYNSGYQPVGYNYAGYSNYTVPAYWYGR